MVTPRKIDLQNLLTPKKFDPEKCLTPKFVDPPKLHYLNEYKRKIRLINIHLLTLNERGIQFNIISNSHK